VSFSRAKSPYPAVLPRDRADHALFSCYKVDPSPPCSFYKTIADDRPSRRVTSDQLGLVISLGLASLILSRPAAGLFNEVASVAAGSLSTPARFPFEEWPHGTP